VSNCYHCGLPAFAEFSGVIDGKECDFCCIGCCAVAQTINGSGLSDYYQYRDTQAQKAENSTVQFELYDREDVQHNFVTVLSNGNKQARLNVGGISCAACSWLIEKYLLEIKGIDRVTVNVSSHSCLLEWDDSVVSLSQVFAALKTIGYRPEPANTSSAAGQRDKDAKTELLRIGIAGLAMMQVGMVSIALYAGDSQGISEHTQHLLRWVSLLFATPVMAFSAIPFFTSARRALMLGSLNMDVPVSLALCLAYFSSIYSTLTNSGEVYFDSVSMFTFLLLLGRNIEARARHYKHQEFEHLSQVLPISVEKIESDARSLIPLSAVNIDDHLWVTAGATIPVDACLLSDSGQVNEAVLTGESELRSLTKGFNVYAGSVNGDLGIEILVRATGADTRLAAIETLVLEASHHKPRQQAIADKFAGYFVAAVLCIFVGVYGVWTVIDSSQAFWVALSVLVVTCPCALSLATPVAITVGVNRLRNEGLLIKSAQLLETLPNISHIIFDKTGTLTRGVIEVLSVRNMSDMSDAEVLLHIAALEKYSSHPIADAFSPYSTSLSANNVRNVGGQGVEGEIMGKIYRFGKLDYTCSNDRLVGDVEHYPGVGLWQCLSCNGNLIAWVELGDKARAGLDVSLNAVREAYTKISLLSGDRQQNVDAFCGAAPSALDRKENEYRLGDLKPEGKLDVLRALQKHEAVLMVGDGINDVPVLSQANVSVAMSNASDLAHSHADAILLSNDLSVIGKAKSCASLVRRVIKQNIAWAIFYNILALPAAASGFVSPWMAALGMSFSSLIVVLNARRILVAKL
jgi:Cu2+-exporting ATPase